MNTIAIVGLTVYVGIAAVLFLLQRRFIYAPDPYRPDPDRVGLPEMAPVTLHTEDGLDLVAWWHAPVRSGLPVMVFMHGNAGNLGDRATKVRPYIDEGWGVLLVTWRGYSGNPGKPSEKGLYMDGRAALSFLRKQGVPFAKIVLYGESLGSAVAVHLATEAEVGVVALEAPFSSLADMARQRFPYLPTRFLVRDRFNSLAKVREIKKPLLLVHGDRDRVIPIRQGRKLYDAAGHPKLGHFIEGADHGDLYEHGTHETVLSFVKSYLAE